MQRMMLNILGILIILFLGSSIVPAVDAGVCPVDPADKSAVVDLPREEVLPAGKGHTFVDRDQVLLEVFGRVT
jgi:hypothetical protein